MAKQISVYLCEACGARYGTLEEAEACEKRHKSFIVEVFAVYNNPQTALNTEPPDRIMATFSNGTTGIYIKDKTRQKKSDKDRLKAPDEREV